MSENSIEVEVTGVGEVDPQRGISSEEKAQVRSHWHRRDRQPALTCCFCHIGFFPPGLLFLPRQHLSRFAPTHTWVPFQGSGAVTHFPLVVSLSISRRKVRAEDLIDRRHVQRSKMAEGLGLEGNHDVMTCRKGGEES